MVKAMSEPVSLRVNDSIWTRDETGVWSNPYIDAVDGLTKPVLDEAVTYTDHISAEAVASYADPRPERRPVPPSFDMAPAALGSIATHHPSPVVRAWAVSQVRCPRSALDGALSDPDPIVVNAATATLRSRRRLSCMFAEMELFALPVVLGIIIGFLVRTCLQFLAGPVSDETARQVGIIVGMATIGFGWLLAFLPMGKLIDRLWKLG